MKSFRFHPFCVFGTLELTIILILPHFLARFCIKSQYRFKIYFILFLYDLTSLAFIDVANMFIVGMSIPT